MILALLLASFYIIFLMFALLWHFFDCFVSVTYAMEFLSGGETFLQTMHAEIIAILMLQQFPSKSSFQSGSHADFFSPSDP